MFQEKNAQFQKQVFLNNKHLAIQPLAIKLQKKKKNLDSVKLNELSYSTYISRCFLFMQLWSLISQQTIPHLISTLALCSAADTTRLQVD